MATTKTTKQTPAPAASDAREDRLEFSVPTDKHQLIVKARREFIDSIADRVESGAPIERAAERKLIAGMLRAWARQIPDAMPGTRKGATRIDPGYVAIHFACLVNAHGRSKSAATAELAEIYGVPAEAVTEAIAKFEEPAMRLVPRKSRPVE